MNWGLGLQQSRLARRLLKVFLLCMLIPVLGLSIVSYLQVRTQLVEQSITRLERDSKAVVMSVLERLVVADGVVRRATVGPVDTSLTRRGEVGVNPISAALWTDVEGSPLHVLGEWPRIPRAEPSELDRLQRGTLLRAHSENGQVFLAQETEEGRLWVAVDSLFLWTGASEFAALHGSGVVCILDHDVRPIRCDDGMPIGAIAPYLATRTPFTIEIDGEPYRAVTREIYFDWYFGAEPWSVVLAEPHSEAIAPLVSFKRIFIPVALLSVLVMLFFSGLQLRRIFERLLHLKSATARISEGEYEDAIKMDGDDEIAELANSFNEMAGKIGHQFALMRSTGEVDRAALETTTVRELCARVVDALGETFPDSTRMVVLGRLSPAEGRLIGSVAYQVPPAAPATFEVALTSEQTSRISTLSGVGLYPIAHVVAMLGVPKAHPWVQEELALFSIRLDGQPHGFVAVGGRGARLESHPELRQLADQISVALSNVKRLDQLQRLNWGALTALARTVDAVSEWTAGHSERVAALSERLGRELGLDEVELERLRRGGLLHDIGKLGTPAGILEKPGKLTDEEFLQIQEHTVLGAKILEPIESFADILPLVLSHHERIDGTGYPMRISGSAIPYGARIMAVADTFDALTSDRPYRKGMELERALGIIEEVSGTQLDSEMVAVFVEMMRPSESDALPTHAPEPIDVTLKPRKAQLTS